MPSELNQCEAGAEFRPKSIVSAESDSDDVDIEVVAGFSDKSSVLPQK